MSQRNKISIECASGVPPGGDVEHSPAGNKNSGDVKSSFQRSAQNNGAALRKTFFFCYLPLPAKLKLRVYSSHFCAPAIPQRGPRTQLPPG